MKTRLITTLAIAFFSIAHLSAQVGIGFKGGVAVTNVAADFHVDAINQAPSGRSGIVGGLFVEAPLSQVWSIRPELLYTQKGFLVDQHTGVKLFGTSIPVGARVNTNINYLEVPLGLKATHNLGGVSLYGIAGPSLGYATSAKMRPQVTLLIPINIGTYDINLDNDIYNRWDVSVFAGAGVEFDTGTGSVFTEVRYQHGLNNVLEDPILDLSIRNHSVQITAGYTYRF